MDEQKLKAYIEGTLDRKDREQVVSWIEESDENFALFSEMKAADAFDTMPYTVHSSRKRKGARRILDIGVKVAAAMAIPLMVLAGYLYFDRGAVKKELSTMTEQTSLLTADGENMMQYSVAPGVKGKVTLPDGSTVWLNSGSKITCPLVFGPKERVVTLSGEGFFDVVTNPEWPMLVKTSRGITAKVLGTQFNFCAYEDEAEVKFTLVSGSVVLVDEKSGDERVAVPSQQFSANFADMSHPEGKIQNVDVSKSTAWKDGILLFDDTPMSEVFRRLERWYGVEIHVEEESILTDLFTASFDSESIGQVLDMIKITSLVDYAIKEKVVTITSAK